MQSSPLYSWALSDESRFAEVTDSPDYKESGLKKLKSKSWESIARWEKENEFLFALIEDESEWLMHLFPDETVAAETFFTDIEDGVLLCKLARFCQNYAEEHAAKEKEKGNSNTPRVPIFLFHIHSRAKCKRSAVGTFGKFMRRENVELFLKWCRAHRIPEPFLFESNDVVERTEEHGMRENAREIVLCLMEVARLGVKWGVDPPKLIQLEREIELEEQMEENGGGGNYTNLLYDSGSISPTSTVDSGVYETSSSTGGDSMYNYNLNQNHLYHGTNSNSNVTLHHHNQDGSTSARPLFDSLDEEADYSHDDDEHYRDTIDSGQGSRRKIILDSSGRRKQIDDNDDREAHERSYGKDYAEDSDARISVHISSLDATSHTVGEERDNNNHSNSHNNSHNAASIMINHHCSDDDDRCDNNSGNVSLNYTDLNVRGDKSTISKDSHNNTHTSNSNKNLTRGNDGEDSNSGSPGDPNDTSRNIECSSIGRTNNRDTTNYNRSASGDLTNSDILSKSNQVSDSSKDGVCRDGNTSNGHYGNTGYDNNSDPNRSQNDTSNFRNNLNTSVTDQPIDGTIKQIGHGNSGFPRRAIGDLDGRDSTDSNSRESSSSNKLRDSFDNRDKSCLGGKNHDINNSPQGERGETNNSQGDRNETEIGLKGERADERRTSLDMKSRRRLNVKKHPHHNNQQGGKLNSSNIQDARRKSVELPKTELHSKVNRL